MEITKNKTTNFILTNIVLPIVLSLIVSVVYDKFKARNETKTKTASQPNQKVPVTTTTSEEEVVVTTTEV